MEEDLLKRLGQKEKAETPFDYLTGTERQVLNRITPAGTDYGFLRKDLDRIVSDDKEYERIIDFLVRLELIKKENDTLKFNIGIYHWEGQPGRYRTMSYAIIDPLTGEKYPDKKDHNSPKEVDSGRYIQLYPKI